MKHAILNNVRLVTLAIAFSIFGCNKTKFESTYPCRYSISNQLSETIDILDCKGLGGIAVDGVVVPSRGGPSATINLPRLKSLPGKFTIEWKMKAGDEVFSQEMVFPRIPRGSFGHIECTLKADNTWEWKFVERARSPYDR